MKWFKHMSDAHSNPKLVSVITEHGVEAYGLYWILIELVAKGVDETDNTSVQYPLKYIQKITGFYPKKLQTLMEHLMKHGLISFNVCEKSVNISCVNILKIRDNHTKNLQVSIKNKEEEEDKEKEIKKSKPNGGGSRVLKPPLDLSALVEVVGQEYATKWIDHRRAIRKPLNQSSVEELAIKLKAMNNPQQAISNSIANGYQGIFEPKDSKQQEQQKTNNPHRKVL